MAVTSRGGPIGMVDMTKSLTCTICSREKLKASMTFISLIGRITPYGVKLSSWLLLVEGMESNVRHSVRGRDDITSCIQLKCSGRGSSWTDSSQHIFFYLPSQGKIPPYWTFPSAKNLPYRYYQGTWEFNSHQSSLMIISNRKLTVHMQIGWENVL